MNKRTSIAIGTVIIAPILLLIGAFTYVHHRNEVFAKNAHAAYQTQLRALAAEGVPTALARLQGPKPAPALDAGPVYLQIAAQLKASPLSKEDAVVTDGFPTGHIPSPTQFAAIHSALVHQAHVMALIHTAAERPQCDLGIDWSNPNPANILFPRFAKIRMAARALSVESLDLAHQGRMREAVQNQALGFRLADHAYTGKTVIAALVTIAIDAITLEGMRKILYLSHGDPATASAVKHAIDRELHPVRLSETLKTELTFEVSEIEFLRKDGARSLIGAGDPDSSNASQRNALRLIPRPQWSAYLDDNGALVVETLRRNRALVDQPYPVSHPKLLASDALLDKERSGAGSLRYLIAQFLLSDNAKLASKWTLIEARAGIIATSAQLLIEKSKTGQFPATLTTLRGALPDPFTGRPLKYRREGAGFVLYSVGENGDFDGGAPKEKPKSGESLFRYPMPAYYNEPMKDL